MRTDQVNVALVIALISWISAQLIKTIFYAVKNKTLNLERIFGAGGMPSAHSATVCSLAIAISRVNTIYSTEFALSMILAMVVMYDAMGVRRSAGLQAKEINRIRKIVDELDEEQLDKLDEKIEQTQTEEKENEQVELKELLGHTPLEVLCGALLGMLIAMAFPIVVVSAPVV